MEGYFSMAWENAVPPSTLSEISKIFSLKLAFFICEPSTCSASTRETLDWNMMDSWRENSMMSRTATRSKNVSRLEYTGAVLSSSSIVTYRSWRESSWTAASLEDASIT